MPALGRLNIFVAANSRAWNNTLSQHVTGEFSGTQNMTLLSVSINSGACCLASSRKEVLCLETTTWEWEKWFKVSGSNPGLTEVLYCCQVFPKQSTIWTGLLLLWSNIHFRVDPGLMCSIMWLFYVFFKTI